VNEWSRTEDWGRAFEKAVRRKPLALKQIEWSEGAGVSTEAEDGKKRKSLSQRIRRRQICPRKRTGRYRFD
jgi:hypothetical protein